MFHDLQATAVETLNHNSAIRLQLGTENGAAAIRPAPTPGCAQRSSTPSSVARPWMSVMAIPPGAAGRSGQSASAGLRLPNEHAPQQAAGASAGAVHPYPERVASTLGPANSFVADLSSPIVPTSPPVYAAPLAETLGAPERTQQSGTADSHQNAHAATAPVLPAAPAVSSATSPGNHHTSAPAAAEDSGYAAETTAQDLLPESGADSANLSPEDIVFGARLLARNAEQPSDPAVPARRPVAIEGLSSAGASSATPRETGAPRAPSGNGTSTPASQEKSDPPPEANALAPPGQHTEHPVPEGSSIAHADQTNTVTAGHHQPVQESGYAPSPARAPETGGPAPSAPRASVSATGPGVRLPETAAPDAPATGTARDIALRLKADDNSAVEVRLSERAGEVRVAVRSADPALTESMRARLPELVDRLGARGYETEIWRPEQPAAERGAGPNPDSHREQPGEQQPGNGQQKRDQPQPEWMEELATSLRQPNAVNRSTNR